MVIYYVKNGVSDVAVYNGKRALEEALEEACPFDGADLLSLQSGELWIEAIKDKNSLREILNSMGNLSNMENLQVNFAPVDTFHGRDAIVNMITSKYEVDKETLGEMLLALNQDIYFGRLDLREMHDEIEEVYHLVCSEA